jgi:beta-galactosidase
VQRIFMPLNMDWLYCPQDDPAFGKETCVESAFQPVCLPHTNVELPYHNFSDREYQFVCWYRKHFVLPSALQGQRLFLDFDGVMMAAEVYVNGQKLAVHKGGYVPFSVEITTVARFEGENILAVQVDARERPDIPPCGGVVDYLTFGGIYREVALRAVNPFFIENLFARPRDVLHEAKRLNVSVALLNTTKSVQTGQLTVELLDAQGKSVAQAAPLEVAVPAGEGYSADVRMGNLNPIALWDLDSPDLYTVRVELLQGEASLDALTTRIGFREASFTSEGPFMLNGRPVKLRGLDRHQTYPYVGGAMPARGQRRDADTLKWELGLNIVRTSHYPQSRHFLDRCDEIGLLVLEEIPGWQHIGDAAWKEVTYSDVRQMIVRDRNHPSIVLWGVRINESHDNHDFYCTTNRLAHELDPSRQTGGIRYLTHSELLEDVYTFNDFIHSGGAAIIRDQQEVTGLPRNVPYLITEFNGHMYPTKIYDQEERMVEHALRHLRVQNAIAGDEHIAGGIGWCAFDYNTHETFGSGDRICYHGVSDTFRFPKFAAFFYESQLDPSVRPVLRIASRWKLGDRSGGGVEPLLIFSNCDYVQLYVGEQFAGTYVPDRKTYPYIPHPPFVCTGLANMWARSWGDLRAVGLMAGKVVIEQRIAGDGVPNKLLLWADDTEIIADGADLTRVAFAVTDRYGNPLPYVNVPVTLSVDGPGTLVGENPFCLVGGVGAVYLRAGRIPGKVTVVAQAPRLSAQTTDVQIRES